MPAEPIARQPWIVLETTPSCNLDCVFCCNPWCTEGRENSSGLLPGAERIIERLHSQTPVSGITVSGGEPLLCSDILGIISTASRISPEVALATNGTKLNRQSARDLANSGLTGFQITLLASTRSTFSAICGSDHQRDALRAVSSAASTGIPVSVAFPVCSMNWSEAADALLLAFANGASSFQLLPLAPGGKATARWSELRPSREKMARVLQMVGEAAEKAGILIYTGIPLPPCEWSGLLPSTLLNEGCMGAVLKWAIDPWGGVRPCEQVGLVLGDIISQSFDEIRASRRAEDFRNANMHPNCPTCSDKASCLGGCRAFRTIPDSAG